MFGSLSIQKLFRSKQQQQQQLNNKHNKKETRQNNNLNVIHQRRNKRTHANDPFHISSESYSLHFGETRHGIDIFNQIAKYEMLYFRE